MGPKKNKKKDDDEQMWNQNQKNLQEILKKVTHSDSKKQHKFQFSQDTQQDINSKNKQAFDWELSKKNLKALQKAQQKKEQKLRQKQMQQQQAKKLSPQQLKQLQRKLQKQKQQKQKKQKKKEQKKAERLKQLQQQKIEQQRIKQQEQKTLEEVEKKLKKTSNNGKCLPIFLGLLIVLLCALQYQKQIHVRLSKFKLENEENFYDIFQIDSGVTDKELKEKYKRLVLKYHPDKNPNCVQCEEKFNKIIKAWQVLGSPQKRKHYDANAGFVTQIKSQSITLTPTNYDNLVEGSKSLWMIQVYDSTEKYCHYFAQFWEDTVQQYGGFVKFGRVDVWTQTDMLSYLPYRFQVFPSIYYYHKGEIGLCSFDFQNPDSSIRRCLESQYKENLIKQIKDLSQIPKDQKVSIIFTDKVKIGSRFKILNKKYETDFNFYSLKMDNKKHQILALLPNNQSYSLDMDSKNPQYHQKYEKFLESLILQKISICELISVCQNQPCYILLDEETCRKERFQIIMPQQNPELAKPVFAIEDKQFYHALEDLKNRTQMRQKFTLGLYQNGHIDLGYIQDAPILNPEQGESFQSLHCVYKDKSWTGIIKESYKKIIQLF